jgi:hypothetical protein
LIETAKMNGVDPAAYLTATLEAIARSHPQSRLDELLPWAAKPASSRKAQAVQKPLTPHRPSMPDLPRD